jgi:mannose-6-phosphate isomerase-like protein (cupin superfamily)
MTFSYPETAQQRSTRILNQLKEKYPSCTSYDMSSTGQHFVCEIEPVTDHPEYDRAIEVIIKSHPHKHLKMTQEYTIIKGTLELHIEEQSLSLKPGDKCTVSPGNIHWAISSDECWVEIYSRPGWTKEDHISV